MELWIVIVGLAGILLWLVWRKPRSASSVPRLTPDLGAVQQPRLPTPETKVVASPPVPRPAQTEAAAAQPQPAMAAVSLPPRTRVQPTTTAQALGRAVPPLGVRWVPAGEPVVVRGYTLPGGMLYVGSGLPTLREWSLDPEPALIDPALPVESRHPDVACETMSYWPSYSSISARARAGYLHWLSGGRQLADVGIGHVFLFFYGLERRLLADGARGEVAAGEVDSLCRELERLLALYGDSSQSFRRYGSGLLGIALLLRSAVDLGTLQPPMQRSGWELPLVVRLALGSLAKEGKPLPAEWALSWVLTAPEVSLRTPALRCPNELRELFLQRYRDEFGNGLVLRENKTRLKVQYQPASASFGGMLTLTTNVPDVASTTAPLERLRRLAEQCSADLDAYSRWVGRTGDTASPAAIALLPAPLAGSRGDDSTRAFDRWLEEQVAPEGPRLIETPALLAHWPTKDAERPTRRELEGLSDFLATRGVGIEPDVTFGGPSLARSPRAALYRLAGGVRETPSRAYGGAAVLLQLAASVAAADGEVSPAEQRHLANHLEAALALDEAQRLRLQARFRCLAADPPPLGRSKKSIEQIGVEERHALGAFLIALAGADGHLAPEELKVLSKIYPRLGLPADAVYADVHQLISTQVAPAEAPVPMRAADRPPGFAIPRIAQESATAPRAVALDVAKVRAKLAETERVSKLLGEIFVEEPAEAPAAPVAAPAAKDDYLIRGLDGPHSALLLTLAGAASWERARLERLADAVGLLPDGAVEVINEAAFAACGASLLEGEDPIEIDRDVLKEMLA